MLRVRSSRGRRARVPAASPCWEAGGSRRVFGGLRPLLRGSWSLGCKATIGRGQGWWCGTNKLYFVSQPPPQPRRSRHKPRSWIYSRCLAALQQAMPATLARVSLWPFKRAPNATHSMLDWSRGRGAEHVRKVARATCPSPQASPCPRACRSPPASIDPRSSLWRPLRGCVGDSVTKHRYLVLPHHT